MQIGGIQKTSLQDYPGAISTILFTVGCNFRCGYCHNPELVSNINKDNIYKEEDIIKFLEKRKKKTDAIVITGGEPTLQKDLIDFISKVKEMGFLVKLDTNGTKPEVVEELIKKKLIDFIAMDIKAPLSKYEKIVNRKTDIKNIKKSIEHILHSNLPHEFRTTVVVGILSSKDIVDIAASIEGANKYVLQKFVPSKTIDPKFMSLKSMTHKQLQDIKKQAQKYVSKCQIR